MSSNHPGSTPRNPNQRANTTANPASVANTPAAQRGVGPKPCRFFNGSGCRKGTRCPFSHVLTPEGDAGPSSGPHPARKNQSSRQNFPGLSNDHFSTVVLNKTAGQTSTALQTYVADSFRFQTPDQVYAFLSLLCAASSQNKVNWTDKEAQTHLHKLVKGNGIIRLAEAMRFPQTTTRAWSFQRGYIPIFTYLSSDWVVNSAMHSEVNALYGLIHNEFKTIRDITEANMAKLMTARSFKEQDPKLLPLSGKQVFKVIFVTIFEYLTRFKDATITNPGICDFTEQMVQWFDEWVAALESNPPFEDKYFTHNQSDRDFIIENLRRDKEHILHLVRRGQKVVVINREAQSSYKPPNDANLALLAELERVFEYDGPGDHSEVGRPRHDNDHTEIEMIQVIPTRDELLCEADPYLPGNFYEAPHYHDPGSVERLLDIQYRLLREEFTSPLRLAVQNVVADLKKSRSGIDVLSQKLNPRSGLYVTATGRDSIRFSVFTGITFQPLKLNHRGLSAGVDFDTPPGKARSHNPAARVTYWEQASKKRLMQDGLVVLVWKTPAGKVDVYLGTVASASLDLVKCARRYGGQDRMSIRVSFFDTKANVRILKSIQNHRDSNDTRVLIEAPVFFESIRPFLEGLKREPERLPFAQYLRLQTRDELVQTTIDPPLYSRSPGFSFELKDLFLPAAGVASLRLTTRDPDSVANARTRLIQDSRLDPSQAEAVIDALTREVALIQGPPGTGKSYTGLEIIRVLIKNNICPILLVAFTNHALDHMLTGILDAEITNNIIRLGSRSSDERLTPYLLANVAKLPGKSPLAASRKEANVQQRELESQMNELMSEITSCKVPSSHIEEHISHMYPHHHGELFRHIPTWIDAITTKPSDPEEEWEVAGESPEQQSIIDFWLDGCDLKFLETPGDELETLTRHDFLRGFMREHGLKDVPKIPKSTRPLNVLQKNPGVWRMSRNERTALHKAWSIEASDVTHGTQIQKFEQVWLAHKVVSKQHKEITEQLKAEILSRSHIVGCTTTGAAKFASLISGMGPKVLIVEEAGQVLESHILASLVGSMQHVILIGDPQQLRPNINCYELATENPNTGQVYKFDQSLMERLSSSGFPMSQIDVQRRMRPEISSLIKNTLYPNLIDNERVLSYPNVRGMHKNMFFFSHTHKEAGGGDESVSKHNSFEVDMIYDLVLHLLKQGCYNTPGNIVILAAYLGQIPKLRKKLEDIVTIVIDERDAELLDLPTNDGEEAGTIKQVELSKQVTIRTLDNFQGEEGEVIILSLVRNSETPFDEVTPGLEYKGKGPIGFLRNVNRTNVGLSRAKHGLYIFGNAPELAQGSKMWSSVLKELHESECLGPKLPISCHRHPDYVQWIENPGELPVASPNGGCRRPCEGALPCGHICPLLCHVDDPNHISTKCQQPCLRLCPLLHPCDRECWECSKDASNCRFPIRDLQLPCGHVHPPTQCHAINVPEKIKCPVQVVKQHPSCGHDAAMSCHQNPASYVCHEQVPQELPQCKHQAIIPCSKDPASHLCQKQLEKPLACGHSVQMLCSQDPAGVACLRLVERKLACGHPVEVPCNQDMSAYTCDIKVEKTLPNCSHHATMPCHQSSATFACQERVTRPLPNCDHPAELLCYQNPVDHACSKPMKIQFTACGHSKRLTCQQLQDPGAKLCQERVKKEISACKHLATMLCHKDPTRHKCQQRVEKKLPFCGHHALVPCHQDAATYFCFKRCGGVLSCCSGTCSAKCGACQKLNSNEAAPSVRTMHSKHMCNRRLACGHSCNAPCREGHICARICKGKCQQSCNHSTCRRKCSTSCKPCKEPCVWKCEHKECTSPCGMACTRLPCDEKCPKTLNCGHPCPSVCGEPCEYQTCKICNDDSLDSAVDLLGRMHLGDLEGNIALGSMTITLPCRHIFTVEALDSITRIRDFYNRDSRGGWANLAMPDVSNVRTRPVCPHCGGEIDSLRYGRILKYFNHSVLQHNIARSLSERLSRADKMFSEVRNALEQAITTTVCSFGTAGIPIPSDVTRRKLLQQIDAVVNAEKGCPTSLELILNLSKFHGFPPRHTKAWRNAMGEVMETYRVAYDVTREADPSVRGYDSSFARFYQEELNQSGTTADPSTNPTQQRRQQAASNAARVRVGHLRPRANERFGVEAFWISIEILMLLGLIVSKACEAIPQQLERGANAVCWENIAEFILLRASKDAETALGLAKTSNSPSKVVRCQLLILQTQYELAAHKYRVAIRNGLLFIPENEEEYFDMCLRGMEQTQSLRDSVPRDYQSTVQLGSTLSTTTMTAEWVQKHFTRPSEKILEAWNNLYRLVYDDIPGRGPEEVTTENLTMWRSTVQKAAASSRKWHTQNFYQCPDGHTYTRGECTIGLGQLWCPECGKTVGNQR